MSDNSFDVFISYSRDIKNFADSLKALLECMMFGNVFVDIHNIKIGDKWFEKIISAISEARIGIICYTKSNRECHPWLHMEAGIFAYKYYIQDNKTKGNKMLLLPLFVDFQHEDYNKYPIPGINGCSLDGDDVANSLIDMFLSINDSKEMKYESRAKIEEKLNEFPDLLGKFLEEVQSIKLGRHIKKSESASVYAGLAQEVSLYKPASSLAPAAIKILTVIHQVFSISDNFKFKVFCPLGHIIDRLSEEGYERGFIVRCLSILEQEKCVLIEDDFEGKTLSLTDRAYRILYEKGYVLGGR